MQRQCLFCCATFEPRLERRLFCTDVCRARHNREEHLRCFYCGDLADTRDHVTPHSAMYLGKRVFKHQETVNACRECNTAAGNRFPFNIMSRVEWLIAKYRRRYHLDRHMPEWDDEELDELSGNLRSAIRGKMNARTRAMERVLHMRRRLRDIVLATNLDDEPKPADTA